MNDTPSFFNIAALAATLPESSDTMVRDLRLTDEAAASCRIVRHYHPVPLHFHRDSDEHLYVVQGRVLFRMGDATEREFGPGELVVFRRGTVHGMPRILEHPFVVLAVDTPRRSHEDVCFVDPDDGTPDTFLQTDSF